MKLLRIVFTFLTPACFVHVSHAEPTRPNGVTLLTDDQGTLDAADSKPNIVMILVDDMGYGDPRCFNPESKIATPNIDKLAAEGMRFTDAHAGGSICVPSRYSLLSGRMPYRNWNVASAKRTKKGDLSALEKKHFPQPQLQHEPGRLNLATLMKR